MRKNKNVERKDIRILKTNKRGFFLFLKKK